MPDSKLLTVPDEDEEEDSDPSTDSDTQSEISTETTSIAPKKKFSRSYRFVQLERALTLANLLNDNGDRIQFQRAYRQSLRENRFEQFLQASYQKLHEHKDKLKQERAIQQSQTFTFVDLEKNFLALDPRRNIKIVFLDDPLTVSTEKSP